MDYKQSLLKESNKIPRRIVLKVGQEVINELEEGIGVAFDISGLGNSLNCFPPLRNKKHWQIILDGLIELKISWMRLRIPTDMVISDKGEVDRNAEVIKRLSLFHELALQNDINIVIALNPTNLWGTAEITKGHSPAPSDLKTYAHNLCPILEYLIKAKKFKQLKYLTIYDEPFNEDGGDFTFATPKGIDPWEYCLQMYKIVKEMLINHEIPIKLIGPVSADVYRRTIQEFARKGLDLSPYIDAFDSHIYRYRLDYLPPTHHIPTCPVSEVVEKYLSEDVSFAKKNNKPYFLTELGCMYYGKSLFGDNRGPSRHEAFITEASLITKSLNIGVDGFLKWAYIFNPTGGHGHYQLLNTFNGSYTKQANYYGYATLCRYLPKKAKVLSRKIISSEGDASGFLSCAVVEKDDLLTIFLVNTHPAEVLEVEINFERKISSTFTKWVNDFQDKHKNMGKIEVKNNTLLVGITPLSLTVLTIMV